MNITQFYLTMYKALAQANDNCDLDNIDDIENLVFFINEASPYIFKGQSGKRCISADPACYSSFKKYMSKNFKNGIIPKDKSYNAVLNHLREYVGNVYPGVIKAFLAISKEEWDRIYDASLEKFKDEKEENWQI